MYFVFHFEYWKNCSGRVEPTSERSHTKRRYNVSFLLLLLFSIFFLRAGWQQHSLVFFFFCCVQLQMLLLLLSSLVLLPCGYSIWYMHFRIGQIEIMSYVNFLDVNFINTYAFLHDDQLNVYAKRWHFNYQLLLKCEHL